MAANTETATARLATSDRRLIEEALPLREISQEAAREKSIRYGHISTLHIWWARRPLVACRAAVLGSLIRDSGDEKERIKLHNFLVEFCRWEASHDPKLIEEARRLVLASNGGIAPRVLDCFAGGGAIPLEALRVGCETFALDLNPVAVLIELCTTFYPQKYGKPYDIRSNQRNLQGERKETVPNRLAYDVDSYGKWILEEAKKRIGHLYFNSKDDTTSVAYLWARTIPCPNPECGGEVPLLRQLWLAKTPKKEVALKILARRKAKSVDFAITKGKEINYDPSTGTMRYGSCECPLCKSSITREYLKKSSIQGRMGERMVAVVEIGENSSDKKYRIAQHADFLRFEESQAAMDSLRKSWKSKLPLVPNEPISRDWPRTILLPLYGITRWGQLFNLRQATALATFTTLINEAHNKIVAECDDKEYAKAVCTYLALVLGRVADYCSSICFWHNRFEMIGHTFGRQAVPMVWDYSEVNPLARTVGGWLPMLDAAVRVIEKWSEGSPAEVRQGTATELPYPDKYFDAVITDPPYYSAVPYADLSDFFYVWLKRTIGYLYPDLLSAPLTPKSGEIVEQMPHSSLKNRKDKAFFENEMTKALKEITRVLKPDGICTIVFAHKTLSAWETLIAALLNSGLSVSSSWPLHTEMKTRLRAQDSAVLASSVWLVCRERSPNAGIGSWKTVQAELNDRVKERLSFFLGQGINGADALLSAIGPALEVYGRYVKVEKVTGEPVSVTEFLDKVREAVAHHALSTVLTEQELGNVDATTAFYFLWKWTFEPTVQNGKLTNPATGGKGNGNHILALYDDALKLARSVGADPEVLLKIGILKQDKEYVRLLDPNERKNLPGLGETARDGTPPATIDMIHRALNLWAAMEQAQLEDYLDKSGGKSSETFWRVAQALSNLLPLQSKEKQLLDGLLARYAGAGEVVRPRDFRSLDEFVKNEKKGEMK